MKKLDVCVCKCMCWIRWPSCKNLSFILTTSNFFGIKRIFKNIYIKYGISKWFDFPFDGLHLQTKKPATLWKSPNCWEFYLLWLLKIWEFSARKTEEDIQVEMADLMYLERKGELLNLRLIEVDTVGKTGWHTVNAKSLSQLSLLCWLILKTVPRLNCITGSWEAGYIFLQEDRMHWVVVVSSYCLVFTYVQDKTEEERSWQSSQ